MNSKADLIVLGNVITIDEHKPNAEAVAVKNDKIIYIGDAEDKMSSLEIGKFYVYRL